MRKRLLIIALIVTLMLACGVFAACGIFGKPKPHAHSYGEWEETRTASCSTEGLKKKVCSCGNEITESIPAGHTYGEWKTVTPAICTAAGSKKKVCSCGDEVMESIPALGHTYGEWQTTTPASCTAAGSKKEVCACGDEVMESIPAPGHTYGEWQTVTPASCTATGSKKKVCACGDEVMESVSVLGHSYDDWQWLTENGNSYNVRVCVRCPAEEKISVTGGLVYDGFTVKNIGSAPFSGEIVIPYVNESNVKVTSIGDWAFFDCSGLTSISIPSSVTSIGGSAFQNCSGLTIYCEAESEPSGWENNWNIDGRPVVWDCKNNDKDVNGYAYIVVNGVVYQLKDNLATVYACSTSVMEVNIPSTVEYKATNYSVTSIGNNAFYLCSGLTSITISASITSIGDVAFSSCSSLTIYCEAQSQQSGWTSDWNSSNRPVVWDCKNNDKDVNGYAYIVVNGVVYQLKDNLAMVYDCSTLVTAANIPSAVEYKGTNYSVTSIGNNAFYDCSKLTSITIPSSVTSIGGGAFGNCSGLESITVQAGNTKYHSQDNCLIKTATSTLVLGCKNSIIPVGVTNIGWQAFDGCSGLTSITIPSSVTSIGEFAFYDCSGLTSITIPISVTNIGYSAFAGCSGLTSITFAEGSKLISIGGSVFQHCSSLTSITIPSSLTSIGGSAFQNCSGLTIYCEAESQPNGWENDWNENNRPVVWNCKNNDKDVNGYAYMVVDGVVYQLKDNFATVYDCSTAITTANIPSTVEYKGTNYSVTSIGDRAFYWCSGLTSIIIPSSVTSIGFLAFEYCGGLTIYCEAESQPSGWDSDWNSFDRPVVWGYKG